MNSATTNKEVTCRKCHATYVPSFIRDFYPDGKDPKVGLCESCMMQENFGPKEPPKEPVDIPEEKIKTLCKPGDGAATCSFLLAGRGARFSCSKGTAFQATIDNRRAAGTMGAKGDNCSGPPDYKPA